MHQHRGVGASALRVLHTAGADIAVRARPGVGTDDQIVLVAELGLGVDDIVLVLGESGYLREAVARGTKVAPATPGDQERENREEGDRGPARDP
ncbi:hypothetical protein [Nocardia grenadensis]|uniref:hypothetical protein n=1 Tax=Nocardia grenadensis TaxID=931537 RepID=UPI003D72F871